MKCMVCDKDGISWEMNECPCCHFPLIKRAGAGDASNYEHLLKKMAEEHSMRIKQMSSIGMTVYSHKKEGRSIRLNSVKEMILADPVSSLRENSISWCEEKFSRIDSDKPIVLDIIVHSMGKVVSYCPTITLPEFKEFWKVGVKLEDKLRFRIVIGKKDEYKESTLIPIVCDK